MILCIQGVHGVFHNIGVSPKSNGYSSSSVWYKDVTAVHLLVVV